MQIPNPEVQQIKAQIQQNLQIATNPSVHGHEAAQAAGALNLQLNRQLLNTPTHVDVDTSVQDKIDEQVAERNQAGRDQSKILNESILEASTREYAASETARKAKDTLGDLRRKFAHPQLLAGAMPITTRQLDAAQKELDSATEAVNTIKTEITGYQSELKGSLAEVTATTPNE